MYMYMYMYMYCMQHNNYNVHVQLCVVHVTHFRKRGWKGVREKLE